MRDREEQRRRRRQRHRRRTVFVYGGLLALVILVAGLLAWSALRPRPGSAVPGQGQAHIALGSAHPPYNSNPPTSGWMTDQTAPWGIHRTEVPDEALVHNLEHGGIWISYRDPADVDLVDGLEALARGYRSKVIVTPRPRNDSRIAVAAWGRILKLDGYDEAKITTFIRTFRNRGPERMAD